MRMIRWVVGMMLLFGLAFSQTDPAEADPVPEVGDGVEAETTPAEGSDQPASTGSASPGPRYRRPQRFLRDTAPRVTKPAPLRLGTFSREWERSVSERLAERRRLLWERVRTGRDGLPWRHEVFRPGGALPTGARNGADAEVERVDADGQEAR